MPFITHSSQVLLCLVQLINYARCLITNSDDLIPFFHWHKKLINFRIHRNHFLQTSIACVILWPRVAWSPKINILSK